MNEIAMFANNDKPQRIFSFCLKSDFRYRRLNLREMAKKVRVLPGRRLIAMQLLRNHKE